MRLIFAVNIARRWEWNGRPRRLAAWYHRGGKGQGLNLVVGPVWISLIKSRHGL